MLRSLNLPEGDDTRSLELILQRKDCRLRWLRLGRADNAQLTALENNRSIEELRLHKVWEVRAVNRIARFVNNNTQLNSLMLELKMSKVRAQDFEQLLDAIARHPALQVVELHFVPPTNGTKKTIVYEADFNQRVSEVAAQNPGLRQLSVGNADKTFVVVQVERQGYLPRPATRQVAAST